MEDLNDTSTIPSNYSSATSTEFSLSNITNASSELSTSLLYNETVETITQSLQTESTTLQPSWNLTKVGESLPKATTTASISLCTTTVSSTSTTDSFDEFGPPEGVEYIFVPLGVMIFVIVLSAVVRVAYFIKIDLLSH